MAERTLLIDGGHVRCPLRRLDVDVEECLGCDRLRDLRIDSLHPALVCNAEPYASRPADLEG